MIMKNYTYKDLDISKHNGFKHLRLVSNDESWGFLRWHSTAIDKLIFY